MTEADTNFFLNSIYKIKIRKILSTQTFFWQNNQFNQWIEFWTESIFLFITHPIEYFIIYFSLFCNFNVFKSKSHFTITSLCGEMTNVNSTI